MQGGIAPLTNRVIEKERSVRVRHELGHEGLCDRVYLGPQS